MKKIWIATLVLAASMGQFASAGEEQCLPITGYGGDIIYGGLQGETFKNEKEQVITQQLQVIYNDKRFAKAKADLERILKTCGGKEKISYTLRDDLSAEIEVSTNIMELQIICDEKSEDPRLDGTSVIYQRINMNQPELSCSSFLAG